MNKKFIQVFYESFAYDIDLMPASLRIFQVMRRLLRRDEHRQTTTISNDTAKFTPYLNKKPLVSFRRSISTLRLVFEIARFRFYSQTPTLSDYHAIKHQKLRAAHWLIIDFGRPRGTRAHKGLRSVLSLYVQYWYWSAPRLVWKSEYESWLTGFHL